MSTPNENAQVATTPAKDLAKATPKQKFQALVESDHFKSQILLALPKHLTPERFIRVLMTATIKTPKLLECTTESMFNCIFTAAAAGLEIDGRRAALVPLRNKKKEGQPLEANLWPMYQGIAELIMRSGLVSNIHADLVCDKDDFEYDRGILVKHRINYREDRGDPYAVYSVIRMKDGSEKVEVMSVAEVERIRRNSPGADADAWRLNWGEMAKKTAFRRASKWVPLSAEIKNVLESEPEPEPVNVTPKPSLATLIGAPETKTEQLAQKFAGESGGEPPPELVKAMESTAAVQPSDIKEAAIAQEDRTALIKACEDAMLAAETGETRVLRYARENLGAKSEHDELGSLPTEILVRLLPEIPNIKKATK